MADLQYVADRIALMDVMLRYAKGVDQRDMALYASVFAEDVEVVGFGAKHLPRPDAWVAYVKKALEAYGPTQHMLGPQLATVYGDIAHCRTDVQALHYMKDELTKTLTLWATYNTDIKRVGGEWRISAGEQADRRQEGADAVDELDAGQVGQQAEHRRAEAAHAEREAEEQARDHADLAGHQFLRVDHDGRERRRQDQADRPP